jgi:hypothetical protein
VGSVNVHHPRPAAHPNINSPPPVSCDEFVTIRRVSRFLTTLGVGRSLSSVDNIGCLHHLLSDNRFGGIRLEIDEQATSLTPTGLKQASQTFRAFGVQTLRARRRQQPSWEPRSPHRNDSGRLWGHRLERSQYELHNPPTTVCHIHDISLFCTYPLGYQKLP